MSRAARLANMLHQYAAAGAQQIGKTRLGTIDSYDPNACAVKVKIQPEGTLTGWLPLLCQAVGNNCGIVAAPNIGDQVEVQFQESDRDCGLAALRLFSSAAQPPKIGGVGAPSGEYWWVHSTGSFIQMKNDGSIRINAANPAPGASPPTTGNLIINIAGNATITVTGTAAVYAAAIRLGAAAADMLKTLCTSAFQTRFNNHIHTTPSGNSGVPTVASTAADMTSIVQAE